MKIKIKKLMQYYYEFQTYFKIFKNKIYICEIIFKWFFEIILNLDYFKKGKKKYVIKSF